MMKYIRHLFGIFCVILMSTIVCNAQKVVLEQIPWTYTADKESDPRLTQKIDYEAWHTPVKTILADLSKKTGVELHAGYSKQDWQVRDRRMNIYLKGVSLGELMDSISRVMKFKWTQKEEKTSSIYTLNLDRKLLSKMQAEADKRANELSQEVHKRRTEMLDSFAAVSKMSDTDLAKLKDTDPYLYMCASTGFAQLVTQLIGEFSGLKDMIVSGDHYAQIPYDSLSHSSQLLYSDVLREYEKYDKIQRKAESLPADLEKRLPGCAIQITPALPGYESIQRTQLSTFGSIGSPIHLDDHTAHHKVGWFYYPGSENASVRASLAMSSLTMDKGSYESYQEGMDKLYDVAGSANKDIDYYFMYDPILDYPFDPDLTKEINAQLTDDMLKSIDAATKTIGDMAYPRLSYQMLQKTIADAAKLNIVSDSYAVVLGDYKPEPKAKISKVLENLCRGCLCNYEKHGSTIELRRRDWFRRRASQIPDELVEEWRNEIKQNNILSLDTYAQMVTLTREQIEENISSDALLDKSIGIFWERRDTEGLMRFYLQLNPWQRKLLFSEDGLDTSMLNKEQRQYFKEMFQYGLRTAWWECKDFGNTDNQALIKASTKTAAINEMEVIKDTGGIQYTFDVTVDMDGNTKKDLWTIHLPLIKKAEETTATTK